MYYSDVVVIEIDVPKTTRKRSFDYFLVELVRRPSSIVSREVFTNGSIRIVPINQINSNIYIPPVPH
jgi:hypothetical protein